MVAVIIVSLENLAEKPIEVSAIVALLLCTIKLIHCVEYLLAGKLISITVKKRT
jgi:hypothetical protein